jgi:hypothetical protein
MSENSDCSRIIRWFLKKKTAYNGFFIENNEIIHENYRVESASFKPKPQNSKPTVATATAATLN